MDWNLLPWMLVVNMEHPRKPWAPSDFGQIQESSASFVGLWEGKCTSLIDKLNLWSLRIALLTVHHIHRTQKPWQRNRRIRRSTVPSRSNRLFPLTKYKSLLDHTYRVCKQNANSTEGKRICYVYAEQTHTHINARRTLKIGELASPLVWNYWS